MNRELVTEVQGYDLFSWKDMKEGVRLATVSDNVYDSPTRRTLYFHSWL